MSVTTKRKLVIQELLAEMVLPEPPLFVVRVVASRGNNLHEVVTDGGDSFLASMPTKFRKNIWIKRGDYVICQPIAEGNKVKAEIVHILRKDNIRYIQERGMWPTSFDTPWDKPAAKDYSDMLPSSDSENESCSEEVEEDDSSSGNEEDVGKDRGDEPSERVCLSDR